MWGLKFGCEWGKPYLDPLWKSSWECVWSDYCNIFEKSERVYVLSKQRGGKIFDDVQST